MFHDPSDMAGTHKNTHHGSASLQVQDTQSEIRVLLKKLALWREESLRHLSEILDSCTNSISKGIKGQAEEVDDLQARYSVTTKWVQNYLQEAVDKLNDEIMQISEKLSVAQPVMELEENDSHDPLEMCEPELSGLDTNRKDGETVSSSDDAKGLESGRFEELLVRGDHDQLNDSDFAELASPDVKNVEKATKEQSKGEPGGLIKMEVERASDSIGNVVPEKRKIGRGRPATGRKSGGSYCAAEGCYNNQKKDGTARGITFHRFPKDEVIRKEWAVRINRREANGKLWMPKSSGMYNLQISHQPFL